MAIAFFFDNVRITLKERRRLKTYIAGLIKSNRKTLRSLNYVFCSDERLLQINKDFLKHDYYTDIITFDLSEGEAMVGEIYISIDRLKDNAKKMGTTLNEELHRVIFQPWLHL
ncbi:MAG TPA: rRNA maturation RNase YbeY, partial [Ferruginibacter sp.]|nr:rRNA maturation RNase YbeY [Ferruginibacter sp.]